MKIFKVNNGFFVLDKIQSVIVQPVTSTSEMAFKSLTEKDQTGRWFIQIAYHNQGAFKTYFDNEEDAIEAYNNICRWVEETQWT